MAEINSPLPGTFYSKSAPDAPPFKVPGESVQPDDTIGLIEVMKTFMEVKAEASGTFAGYVVEDGTPVSPGELLANLD